MSDAVQKQEPPYGLRMPPELKARVKAAAEANNRSMNAEIVALLEREFPAPAVPKLDEILGHAALLELFNTPAEDRPKLVLALNERLAAAGSVERLTFRKGKIKIIVAGDFWSPEMALD